jgi:hypothetical protein
MRYFDGLWGIEFVPEEGEMFTYQRNVYQIIEKLPGDYVMAIKISLPTGGKKKICIAEYREEYLKIIKDSKRSVSYQIRKAIRYVFSRWSSWAITGSSEKLGAFITEISHLQSIAVYNYINKNTDYFFCDGELNEHEFERLMAYIGTHHISDHIHGLCEYVIKNNGLYKCLGVNHCISEHTFYNPDGFVEMEALRGDDWRQRMDEIMRRDNGSVVGYSLC